MRASLDVAIAKPGALPPHILTLEDRLRTGFAQVDRLLESFLALARAQQAHLADQCTLSLDEIACAALTRHADAISRLELTIDRQERPEGLVTGNETLLSRMVENVIENAIDHNQPRGWINITSNIDGAFASLVVQNGGELLAQDDVDRLAQPFRRLSADRTGSENGAGLGLSIVAAIAHAHDGKLDLHARSDGGLRVTIELPLAAQRETRRPLEALLKASPIPVSAEKLLQPRWRRPRTPAAAGSRPYSRWRRHRPSRRDRRR
jgi:signal transduction histidine kinase